MLIKAGFSKIPYKFPCYQGKGGETGCTGLHPQPCSRVEPMCRDGAPGDRKGLLVHGPATITSHGR
jgi:hypothetical protein